MPKVRTAATTTSTDTAEPPAESAAAPATPIQLTPAPLPKDRRDLEGFEYLAALSPGEWEDRLVYLYRQDPSIQKSEPGAKKYIAKLGGAFDEEFIRQRFGGGRFLAIVKNQRIASGEAEKKFSFEIEGAPKLQADEKLVAPSTPAAAPPAATGGVDATTIIQDLNQKLYELFQQARDNNLPEGDALARVTATMQKGTEAVIAVMQRAMEARTGSGTGNPLTDELVKAAIARMDGRGADNGLASIKTLVEAIQTLGFAQQRNPFSMLKDLRDGLGIDLAEMIRGAGGGGKTDWKAQLASAVPSIFEGLTSLLDRFSALQRQNFEIALQTHRERQAGRLASAQVTPAAPTAATQLDFQAPVLPPRFATAAPPAPPAADAETAAEDGGQAQLERILTLIVRCFKSGKAGDFAAALLQEAYPDQLATFRAILPSDVNQLVELAKGTPILAEIAADPEFPEFASDLLAELSGQPPSNQP